MMKIVIDCNVCNRGKYKKDEVLNTVEIEDFCDLHKLVCPTCKSSDMFFRNIKQQ